MFYKDWDKTFLTSFTHKTVMNVFREPIPQKPVEKDTKVEETKERTGKGTHIITTKWDISNSLGAKIVKMFLTGTRDYISKWWENGFLRKVVTGSTSPFERVKTTFYGMGPGFRKAITTVGVSTLLVGMLSFPFNTPVQAQSLNTQGQTSIQKILEQRKKQQSQLSSEETQVQETSQQNNLIKQPDVDPNWEYNPPQEFIYIKGLPGTLWSKVDLQPKDNEKFGIPRLSPGMTPDMIAREYKNWEEIYSKFIGVSDLMEVKVRYYRGSFVGADIIMKTDKGEFVFSPTTSFYPVAVSVDKDKISLTSLEIVSYKGVDGKRHYAATYALQLVAERGKPPKYILHNLATGITVIQEYRKGESIFEDPMVKEDEKFIRSSLNYLEKLVPNDVKVTLKEYVKVPLGVEKVFKGVVVKHKPTSSGGWGVDAYNQKVDILAYYPLKGNSILVIARNPNNGEMWSVKVTVPNTKLSGWEMDKKNRHYIYFSQKGGDKGMVIRLDPIVVNKTEKGVAVHSYPFIRVVKSGKEVPVSRSIRSVAPAGKAYAYK